MAARWHIRANANPILGSAVPRGRNRCRRAAAWILGLFLIAPCYGVDEAPLEYQVKSAFLLNFTKFVEWPATAFADARAPLTICILGEDPFGASLDQMVQGEVVGGRRVEVQRIRGVPEPKSCQVLYIRALEKGARQILTSAGQGVLTVGEGEMFLRQGGMIAFVVENRRVRFDVDQGAASDAMLSLSSRLLSVARSVKGKTQEVRP